jgi:hypothetical protein
MEGYWEAAVGVPEGWQLARQGRTLWHTRPQRPGPACMQMLRLFVLSHPLLLHLYSTALPLYFGVMAPESLCYQLGAQRPSLVTCI